jgi:hypothetical protein
MDPITEAFINSFEGDTREAKLFNLLVQVAEAYEAELRKGEDLNTQNMRETYFEALEENLYANDSRRAEAN